MEKEKVFLLGILLIGIASLFTFASWTNANVVAKDSSAITLDVFSTISSFAVGVFIVVALAILVILSVNQSINQR